MTTLLVELDAHDGKQADLMSLLARLAAHAAKEPGAIRYDIHVVDEHPTRVVLLERYESPSALQAHMDSEPVREALAVFGTLLRQPPRIVHLSHVSGIDRPTPRGAARIS